MPDSIKEVLSDANFSGYVEGALCQSETDQQALLEKAKKFAITPISAFKVGALVVGDSGRVYLGANMEFTGVPLHASLHAEQSAVLNAWMHGENSIRKLIVSDLPCGHCRQFLQELHSAAELEISAMGSSAVLADLMPKPFAEARRKGQSLLDSPKQKLVNAHSEDSNHYQRVINAASRSYTPYSKSPEGFVIETINGSHFAGRTAESIAFNPSVPAVITALNQLNLSAHRQDSIYRCSYARLATALTHSLAFSKAVMRGITGAPIQSVLMETGT